MLKALKKFTGSILLKLLGFRVQLEGDVDNLNRCILVVAPHTSNWEYFLGNLIYMKYDKPLKIIIKDAHTKAWYGGLVKAIGGIGIDRSQRNNMVDFVRREFEKDSFSLVITPEGTRSRVEKWRMGFYQMALSAQVPICFGAADFKYKVCRIGYSIPYERLATEPKEVILKEIEAYFAQIHPKFPENYNPKIF